MSQLVPFLTEDPLPPSRNRRSPVRWTVTALGVIALIVAGVWAVSTVRGLAPEEQAAVAAGQPVDAAEYEQTLRSEVASVVRSQANTGVDVISDGEFGKVGGVPRGLPSITPSAKSLTVSARMSGLLR